MQEVHIKAKLKLTCTSQYGVKLSTFNLCSDHSKFSFNLRSDPSNSTCNELIWLQMCIKDIVNHNIQRISNACNIQHITPDRNQAKQYNQVLKINMIPMYVKNGQSGLSRL